MEFLLQDKVLAHLNNVLRNARIPDASFSEGGLFVFGNCRRIVIRENITRAQIPYITQGIQSRDILITNYITKTVADLLFSQKIEYIDATGNMYLQEGFTIILIKGNPKPIAIEEQHCSGRAFSPTGLKALFLLLTEPDAINWNYRQIAKYAGISLGSVRYIMADLQNQQYLQCLNNTLYWNNRQEVIAQWCSAYAKKILPKVTRKYYTGIEPYISTQDPLLISGETVAQKMNLMNSSKTLLWQYGNINAFILNNGLNRVDHDGNIEIRDAFWPPIRHFKDMVPYLLIYADLLAENNSRCLEVAQSVYGMFLKG